MFVLSGCSLIAAPDKIRPGTGGSSSGATTVTSTGTVAPQCTKDADCAGMVTDCHPATCGADGNCAVGVAAAGTACGSAMKTDCDAPDACDATGTCQKNLAADGSFCADCPMGPGMCALCSSGMCNNCTNRATVKTFQNAHAAAGWKVSNPLDWAVTWQTAPSFNNNIPSFVFAHPVFGTDGNRAHPWPGYEAESSFAESPPTVIPAKLQFMSWNRDEGANYDEKTISISVDGGASYTIVAVCPASGTPYPFCQGTFGGAVTWQPATIDLSTHPELVGKVGTVKFQYDTYDELTGFEQGWYIDQLNFAQDCACSTDNDCALENSTCGKGQCDPATKQCLPTAQNTGMPCGDMMAHACNDVPTCDPNGLCNPNWFSKEATPCGTCPDGVCVGCGAGQCLSCPAAQDFGDQFGARDLSKWTLTGDWKAYTGTPPDNFPSYPGTPPNNLVFNSPGFGAGGTAIMLTNFVLGTDGSRTAPYYTLAGVSPNFFYQATANHIESSMARTPVVVIPQKLTFKSWNEDRGGSANGRDQKKVRITTDGGTTFKTLVDCFGGAMNTEPFCMQVTTRTADMWDMISIDTGALAGQMGQVEFDYDSVDTGSNGERGWFIDDLNVARCGDH